MLFQQIRSASVKVKCGDVCFLIDPWLMDACSDAEREAAMADRHFISKPVVPLPMPAEEVLRDVDHILVTHMHSDHFSPDYLPRDAHIILQNQQDAEKAAGMGFANTDWFRTDVMTFGKVTVYRTEGIHGDSPETAKRMGAVSGFVFAAKGENTLYVAGDTVYCSCVTDALNRFHPAAVVVNSCDARIPGGRLIMNADDVMELCRHYPGTVIASHMDTVSHAHLSRKELRRILQENNCSDRVLIPADGEVITI